MNPEENNPRLLISTDHKCDINLALEDTSEPPPQRSSRWVRPGMEYHPWGWNLKFRWSPLSRHPSQLPAARHNFLCSTKTSQPNKILQNPRNTNRIGVLQGSLKHVKNEMEMVNFYGLPRHWRFQRLNLIPEERTMLNLKPKRWNVLRAGRYRTHAKSHVCNCSWFYILVFMGLLWRFSTKSMRNKTASETPKVLSGQTQSNIIFGAAGYRLQTRGRSKHLDGTPCFNDLFLGLPNMEKQVVSWKKNSVLRL